ncbi:MAG: hypothetical protein GJ680_00550 [Alteromonadaceae bacterium]|nr:hypothetical protein [Alteromonadaceae bacterium]
MNVILAAIPLFFILIAIEFVVDRRRNTGFYRLNDAIASLTLGIVSRLVDIVKRLIPFTVYYVVFDSISLLELPSSPIVWVIAFVVYDFFYYWLHRFSHEINVLWAAHVVHHSSEDYNLTTALRQTSGSVVSWIFFLPMAVAGVPPEMFISIGALNLVYQFWVHTQHIDRLGWMEYVFITPSNHRVHHAQNDKYIDCNYGGVFILWDRMFGTFVDEDKNEPVVYGVRVAFNSWDPVFINLKVYRQLIIDAWHAKRWQDKLSIWFRPTGWRPDDVARKYPLQKTDLENFEKFESQRPPHFAGYVLFQHVCLIVLTLAFMLGFSALDAPVILLTGGLLLVFAVANCLILAGVDYVSTSEVAKHCLLLTSLYLLPMPNYLRVVLVVIASISMIWLLVIHSKQQTSQQQV